MLCFYTFLGPDISPAAGKDAASIAENGCVREEAPAPQTPAVWLADPAKVGGPKPSRTAQAPDNNAIKGMLCIPHVVLGHKLDGDG